MLGRKAAERRREQIELASRAADAAMAAVLRDDFRAARDELSATPKKLDFAEAGWKVALVEAVIELKTGKIRSGVQKLEAVVRRLDETDLSRDDMGYLRLFALYRATESAKDGKAPAALRMQAENFRFDHTLVSPELKTAFPLKKIEERLVPPPPPPPPQGDANL